MSKMADTQENILIFQQLIGPGMSFEIYRTELAWHALYGISEPTWVVTDLPNGVSRIEAFVAPKNNTAPKLG